MNNNVFHTISVGVLWYASSCFATTTTKVIMRENILKAEQLLVFQLAFSVIYLKLFCYLGFIDVNIKLSTAFKLKVPFLCITLAYVIGFLLLQLALQMVSVSFAVTFRGFEPVVTCIFSVLYLSETILPVQWLATGSIVAGISLCAGSDKTWTQTGLVVLLLCDICFSLRSLFVKHLHKKSRDLKLEKLGGGSIYFVTCIIGSVLLLSIQLLYTLFARQGNLSVVSFTLGFHQLANQAPILAVNTACFTLYNAASYIMLGKIRMSYHAILNSVRQVVVIFFSLIFFGSSLTLGNIFGIFLVAAGVITYSMFKEVSSLEGVKPAKVE